MKLRDILLVLGLIGLAIAVILNIHQLSNFARLLSTLKWYVLVAIVIIQLFSYYLNGLYYRAILRVFNYTNVPLYRLFSGAMAANFVNYIVPTAGFAGAGFFSQVLHPEVPRGKGVLVQFMRYGLSALGAVLILPIGIALVLITRRGNTAVNSLAISASLAIIAVAMVLVYIVNQENWTRKVIKWLERKFKRLFSKIRTGHLDDFLNDFYVGYHTIRQQKKGMLRPFGWSIVYVFVEMLTLYLAFLAFGKVVNPGVVIMGYLLANISSTIGGALFSFGVFEVGMVGTFVALGEPFVLSLSITLVYRIMNLIIGLPAGFVFYRKFLRQS